jgi:histidine triad (HIT) family protein
VASTDCAFCSIAAGPSHANVVDEDAHTVCFLHPQPATRGHALVIPRRHSEDLYAVEGADLAHVILAAQRLALRFCDRLEADGINLINACRPAAWQTVFHFHMHVVPRYAGDELVPPWMPQAGDPAELEALAATLRG